MPKIRSIPLKGRVPGGARIDFLRVEMSGGEFSPFALIRSSDAGVEQPLGLRLDLDKRAVLDHFDDPAREHVLEQALPEILEVVSDEIGEGEDPAVSLRRDLDSMKELWRDLHDAFGELERETSTEGRGNPVIRRFQEKIQRFTDGPDSDLDPPVAGDEAPMTAAGPIPPAAGGEAVAGTEAHGREACSRPKPG